MKHSFSLLKSGIGTITMVLLMLTTLFAASPLAHAASPATPIGIDTLTQGPVTLITNTTRQLPQVTLPVVTPLLNLLSCLTKTVDLKVLVITADGNEADLPAIKQTLDYLGTPYSVYQATQTPNGLTPDKLANGCHGYYQGIILTDGALAYFNGSQYVSALSAQEWANLWSYQTNLGVRLVSWYTLPSADYGYQAVSGITTDPLGAKLTTAGQKAFPYIANNATITIQYAYTYLANALSDGSTTPLLTDSSGHALGLVHKTSDGRETLSLTFDSNPNLTHSIVLSYGLINWLTKGLFLGERHIYMSPQVDDLFIDDSDWQPTTICGTNPDSTNFTYRINNSDLQSVLSWQNSQRANAVTHNLTLTMAYNGFGTTAGAYSPDTLTPAAQSNQAQFYWVSHTFNHTNLDAVDYATATSEISQNNQTASTLGFTHFSTSNMVTPDISGLTNPNYLQAAFDNGIRYLVTDTSKPGYNNPTPNTGIYNSYQPQILMIPRHPDNLFYNVSTPDAWVAEYNCIYHNFWGRDLSYNEILDLESQVLVTYMLRGELDPWMFHQPNMRAYDGVHTLLGDLLGLTLQKYQQYYNLAVTSPTMDQLGQTVAQRMQYNLSGVTASITKSLLGNLTLTVTVQKAARVPVTGLSSLGAESYGGQPITYVNLGAGQSATFLLP